MKMRERWIVTLLYHLDTEVDDKTRAKVLEACGRTCLPASLKEKARKLHKSADGLDGFLQGLEKLWPQVKRAGGRVFVVYPQCYCHLLKGFSGKISPSFCLCSVGYVKELFEHALGRPVEVDLETSIVRGDAECRFAVKL